MSTAIGIDLGTTNTVAAAVKDGTARTLVDEQGRRLVPSIVSFPPTGNVLVGSSAKERRIVDAPNTIYSVKRLIGRAWASPEVQDAKKRFPFEMREGPKQGTVVVARGEQYTLPEISAFVLRHAKAVAEKVIGEAVERAVITVPANFNDLQRAATKVAGKLAGLQVLRILNEPTAAALAYGQQEQAQSERIAVYDLGGGTFDITILDLSGSVYEVLATAGDMALGGDDIDTLLSERMIEACIKQHRFDPRSDPTALATLKMVAESVKKDLSARQETAVELSGILPDGPRGKQLFSFKMTRAELEQLAAPLIQRTFQTCQMALDNAHLKVGAIHRTILVGGATRMPMLVKKVEEFFKRSPYMKINPDEVVALGAAIQAGALDRSKKTTPKLKIAKVAGPAEAASAGSPGFGGQPSGTAPVVDLFADLSALAPTMSAAPAARAPDAGAALPELSADPHAMFAEIARPAPQMIFAPPATRSDASRLARGSQPLDIGSGLPSAWAGDAPLESATPMLKGVAAPLLIDVTPLSLSVETVGGFGDVLIARNTPVPCDKTRVFSTARDNQTSVTVRVAQGESAKFASNTFLGELELSGITLGARGEVAVAVTFELDADGILNVRARDQASGQETACKIHLVGAQNEVSEIDAMLARQATKSVG